MEKLIFFYIEVMNYDDITEKNHIYFYKNHKNAKGKRQIN